MFAHQAYQTEEFKKLRDLRDFTAFYKGQLFEDIVKAVTELTVTGQFGKEELMGCLMFFGEKLSKQCLAIANVLKSDRQSFTLRNMR